MIKSEHGIVNIAVPDYEKILGISPAKARINEESYLYADFTAILDAIADQYGENTLCDMIEQYLKDKLKENSHD